MGLGWQVPRCTCSRPQRIFLLELTGLLCLNVTCWGALSSQIPVLFRLLGDLVSLVMALQGLVEDRERCSQ